MPGDVGKVGEAACGTAGQLAGPMLSRPLAQPVPLGVLARLAGLDEPSGAGAARPDADGTAEAGAGDTGARPDHEGKM